MTAPDLLAALHPNAEELARLRLDNIRLRAAVAYALENWGIFSPLAIHERLKEVLVPPPAFALAETGRTSCTKPNPSNVRRCEGCGVLGHRCTIAGEKP